MKAKIKMKNSIENQSIARNIRDANRERSNTAEISFSKDLSEIYFEGDEIWIPEKQWFTEEMLVEGQAKEREEGIEIQPVDKGKTVNIHLDADLVAELNDIKNHVMSKSQHDIVLELFKKGIDQYNKEHNDN
ncbi:hypothetical protein [Alteribacillus iranensis]|uniref:Uncharacterized protein n=1 Tax=Alteribacillus iranensis TaxID=930128 RepID=A0A1I2DMF7_9BACI|nr:hypothetical protein [Alteribacillus iranensis]SFE81794.1 hypothetical protein SAMN05192532_104176 [Alteribacillus iranensis]